MKTTTFLAPMLAFLLLFAPAAYTQEVTPPPDADGAADALKNSPRHG